MAALGTSCSISCTRGRRGGAIDGLMPDRLRRWLWPPGARRASRTWSLQIDSMHVGKGRSGWMREHARTHTEISRALPVACIQLFVDTSMGHERTLCDRPTARSTHMFVFHVPH